MFAHVPNLSQVVQFDVEPDQCVYVLAEKERNAKERREKEKVSKRDRKREREREREREERRERRRRRWSTTHNVHNTMLTLVGKGAKRAQLTGWHECRGRRRVYVSRIHVMCVGFLVFIQAGSI